MRSKVAAAQMASEAGIPAVICNGTEPGTLAVRRGGDRGWYPLRGPGREGVQLQALDQAREAGREDGIAVDDGAARVLRESGSSLLPVGIAAVDGDFEAGDAVDVTCDGGGRSARASATTPPGS